ncbi:TolC family outer membrane protein [Ferrovibrio sp.]|uniref:TolC family outer membrane protein n=1 Tax=Ferrovibrio sp. TaxID=1917215 RepID=UPI003D0D42A4
MKRFSLLLLPLLLLPETAAAQSLLEAMAQAYRHNPQLLGERARQEATDELVPQALAGWRPTIAFYGENGKEQERVKVKSNNRVTKGRANLDPNELALQATQPLYRGGRLEAQTESAELQVQAGRHQLIAVEQNVLLSAVQAYIDVSLAKAVADVYREHEGVLRQTLVSTQGRRNQGAAAGIDVAQAEARLAQAEANRISYEGKYNAAREIYRQVIGEYPTRPALPPNALLPYKSPEELVAAARDNPNVLAATTAEAAARKDIDVARGARMPSVDLVGVMARTYEEDTLGERVWSRSVKLQVTMPLYEGGMISSKERQAAKLLLQRRFAADTARRGVESSAAQAWAIFASARASREALDRQLAAQGLARRGTEAGLRAGSNTTLDLLNADDELAEARVQVQQARHDEVLASYQVLAAAGDLTAKALNLPVELHDPTRNYDAVRNRWIGWGEGE